MKKSLTKILALILTVVMVLSCAVPVFAESKAKTAVIVVNGINNNPIINNPNSSSAEVVWPPDDNSISDFEKGIYGLMPKFKEYTAATVAMASGKYNEVLNYIVGSDIFTKMQFIMMNPDGTSKSYSLGANTYDHPVSYYMTDELFSGTILGGIGETVAAKYGEDSTYVFTYDWRLDPTAVADDFAVYIDDVKKSAGVDKVKIISEGYGSTIACTYLATHLDEAKDNVSNFVTVNSAFEGTSLIGDIFTGRLMSQSTNVINQAFPSAYIRYTNDISDNPITWFATWLVNYILNREYEIQSLCMDICVMMANIKKPLYDKYLRQMLKSNLGLWALVPYDYYDDALEFMEMNETDADSEDNPTYNEKILNKIDNFKQLQATANKWLPEAQKAGIAVEIVSSWNIQLYPLGDNSSSEDEVFGLSAQSDGVIDTYFSSFGGFTIPLNDVGAGVENTQRNKEGNCANHNHLSAEYDYLDPDHRFGGIAHYVDASTCILPENTWFLRNMKHSTFDAKSNTADFIQYLLDASTDTTVWTQAKYQQFLNYNRYVKPGSLTFYSYYDENAYLLLGDVNLDGKVNAIDARLALRMSAKLEEMPKSGSIQFKNADVNGNGVITAADARIILRVSAGLASFSEYRNTSDVTQAMETTTAAAATKKSTESKTKKAEESTTKKSLQGAITDIWSKIFK